MRGVVHCLMVSTLVAWVGGCAETGAGCSDEQILLDGNCLPKPQSCEGPVTKSIAVGCKFNIQLPTFEVGYFPWELTVTPTESPIVSDFGVTFTGNIVLDRATFNTGQVLFEKVLPPSFQGFRRATVSDAKAIVHVRRGADGSDVELGLAPHPYTCTYTDDGRTDPEDVEYPECDPEHDVEGGNTDCIGLGGGPNPMNPCLLYFPFETSDDCSPDGACARVGATGDGGPCDLFEFCATDAIKIPLGERTEHYEPDGSGSVLFGWADQGVDVVKSGANRGTYQVSDMGGLSGFTLGIAGLPVPLIFDCVMGVNSRSADGVGSVDPLLSPSPDAVLISCPIEAR